MRSLFVLMFMLAATVFAGTFVIVVVATPGLYDQGMSAIPVAVGLGVLAGVPAAYVAARIIWRANGAT